MATEDDILATLDAYDEAYCAKDVDAVMAIFDERDDISVIGTGSDELCSGREPVRDLFFRNFEEASASRFEWHWTRTAVRGDTAVIARTLSIHLELEGRRVTVPLRWTVALAHTGGRWVWLHRHASSVADTQGDGRAYPTN